MYIEPKHEPGSYDREAFLVLKEFEPSFSQGGDMAMDFLAPSAPDKTLKDSGESAMKASLKKGMPHGYEVGYRYFTINGRMLGHGEPVRVKTGERVLFHVLNGSATEIRSLALPGHTFKVVALDGNPVPTPWWMCPCFFGSARRSAFLQSVEIEKIDCVDAWRVWRDDDRSARNGNCRRVCRASWQAAVGNAQAISLELRARFGENRDAAAPDEVIDMTFAKRNAADQGFNQWTINDMAFSMDEPAPMFHLRQGRRYRLHMRQCQRRHPSDPSSPAHFRADQVCGPGNRGNHEGRHHGERLPGG